MWEGRRSLVAWQREQKQGLTESERLLEACPTTVVSLHVGEDWPHPHPILGHTALGLSLQDLGGPFQG